MVCQKCGQKQASVFISQTVNHKTTQIHLCEECAGEQTALGGMNPFAVTLDPSSMLKDFFSTLFPGFETSGEAVSPSPGDRVSSVEPSAQCPICGYQFGFFKQSGRLGCPQCYKSFSVLLEPVLSSIHGTVNHVEEALPAPPIPRPSVQAAESNPTLADLKTRLQAAISQERFEEAAALRDQIHQLRP